MQEISSNKISRLKIIRIGLVELKISILFFSRSRCKKSAYWIGVCSLSYSDQEITIKDGLR